MSNTTIIHIVGNRPQFIKLAVLYDAIAKHTRFQQYIIHTNQHSSEAMSGIFFEQLSIPLPDVQLNIEAVLADEFIGKAAMQIHQILLQRRSDDLILVYGDTNTTLAASMAARRCNKTLLHVEAGVRTADTSMPEEINRIVSDRLAQIHYCCTQKNVTTLLAEGYGAAIASQIIFSGDLMLDAFLHILPSDKKITTATNYIACTIHRAANITNRENLHQIVGALHDIHKQMEVIVPLHPHTAKRLIEFGIEPDFTVIKSLGYSDMKRFLCDANYVITDSGGVSREAFFAKKKSLIVMDHPFWPEIAEANAALHCGADKEAIIKRFDSLSTLQSDFTANIFGDGNAAIKIAEHLNTLSASQ